jgi:phage terminase large subunit GpA-like protein
VKIRNRNEPFDLRVYNTAALEMLGMDLNAQRREALRQVAARATQEAKKPVPRAKPRQGNWASGWKDG